MRVYRTRILPCVVCLVFHHTLAWELQHFLHRPPAKSNSASASGDTRVDGEVAASQENGA